MIYLSKKDFLTANGTYNKNYKKVKDSRFISDDFFDPTDIVQVKYEMLKEGLRNNKIITCDSNKLKQLVVSYISNRCNLTLLFSHSLRAKGHYLTLLMTSDSLERHITI